MNRWLHELTKKEIWQLHHDVICKNSLKKCEISKLVNDVTDETEVECTFYENWHDGKKIAISQHRTLSKTLTISIGKHQVVI